MAAALALGGSAAAAPFEVRTLRVPGRPIAALAASAGLARPQLVMVSVTGAPPEERRWISVFPTLGAGGVSTPAPWSLEVGSEVVAFDVADLGPEPGAEVALLTARELRIVSPDRNVARLPLEAPLPLPPRTRQLSRLRLLRDWNGEGRLSALLPSLGGALLVSLDGASARALELPLLAEYETGEETLPVHEGYATLKLTWPDLSQADDDGDGRLDLFALSRFDLWVFRSGPAGLARQPHRRLRLPRFSFEEERRPESNALHAYARDVDGDGLADLVVHRTAGTLLRSHATTAVYANAGEGASPRGEPAARLEARGGFGSIQLEDLDADGRLEMVQSIVPFGVVQVIRVLMRRRVEARLRVYRFQSPGIGPPVRSWESHLGYPLDFERGRIVGLLPVVSGDWNGDGRRDLLHGDGSTAVEIRLGRSADEGPAFGPTVARQELPAADRALVQDLDGDGLDDLVVYDPLDLQGRVHLGLNRGVLPGGPSRLREAE